MSTNPLILSFSEDDCIRSQIARQVGEEIIIERTKDGHVGQIEVSMHGRPVVCTICVIGTVPGEWEDWYLESVAYT